MSEIQVERKWKKLLIMQISLIGFFLLYTSVALAFFLGFDFTRTKEAAPPSWMDIVGILFWVAIGMGFIIFVTNVSWLLTWRFFHLAKKSAS